MLCNASAIAPHPARMGSGGHQKHAGIEDEFSHFVGFYILGGFGCILHHFLLASVFSFIDGTKLVI
jgi:hypothetical protein